MRLNCNNETHTFTNGKHDPIIALDELANHIATVRIIATTFNDHLKDRYNVFVNGLFGFYLCGFENGKFVSECRKMLKELKSLVKYRHLFIVCVEKDDVYERLLYLIKTYDIMLDNLMDFTKSEIKLILSDLINEILKYYDIELLDSDSESSELYSETLSSSDNEVSFYISDSQSNSDE